MPSRKRQGRLTSFASLCLCVFALSFCNSCTSKPTDLRTLIPADSLVYLESNDLGAVMKTITDRPAFREAAKTVPDLSVLNGVRLAVAVTGFETKEQPVTDENSVLNFQPRFVAVLETNAWNFQATNFTENQLGEFINKVYGGEVLLETSDKHDGKFFVWKATDGRKAFALVEGSLIFFGNDDTAIEKSLAVKRGEADSIAKNPKVTNGDRLAFGYVSQDGVAQIANVLGVKFASEASDEPEVQTAVSGIIPQLLRNSVKEIVWKATIKEDGMADVFSVALDSEVAKVLSETMVAGAPISARSTIYDVIPENFQSITRYDLKNPQIAWRSVLLSSTKGMNPLQGAIVSELSKSLFEPFGIADPESFLGSIESKLITVKLGEADDKVAVIFNHNSSFYEALSSNFDFKKSPAEFYQEGSVYRSKDGAFSIHSRNPGEFNILGNSDTVDQCSRAYGLTRNWKNDPTFAGFLDSNATSVTIEFNASTAALLADVLSEKKESAPTIKVRSITETSFDKQGIERRTTSDFGFLGWIITQFGKEN